MEGDNWMDIRADYKKGLSYTEIGKKYDIEPRTARKYSETEKKPKYPENTNRKSKIEAYKHAINELLSEASYVPGTQHPLVFGKQISVLFPNHFHYTSKICLLLANL